MKLFVSALFCLRFLCAATTAAGGAHPGDELYVFPGQGTCVMYFTMVNGISTAIISDAGAFNGVHPKFAIESQELALLRPKPIIKESIAELREQLRQRLHPSDSASSWSSAAGSGASNSATRCLGELLVNTTPPRKARRRDNDECEDDAAPAQAEQTPEQNKKQHNAFLCETITKSSAQKYKTTIDFERKIHESFARFDPKLILCFFSHCDNDHWNLHDLLPPLPTIFIVGLGWSNEKLNILGAREDSLVIKICQEITNVKFGDYIIRTDYRRKAFNVKGLNDNFILALNFIHLWGVNLCPTRESNANSMLLSINSAQLNKTFIMTGDATAETFAALEEKGINPSEIIRASYPEEAKHLIFALVPHHGSSATFTEKFITMIRPDACIITAGRGSSYGHPRIDIVKILLKNPSRRVWDRFNMVNPVAFLGFNPTGKQGPDIRYEPMDIKLTVNNPLILGTNVSQRLRFSIEGVFQEFNPFLTIGSNQYVWDYCNHAYEYVVSSRMMTINPGFPIVTTTTTTSDGIIGHDSDGAPIAYFIQMNEDLWYGYPVTQIS